MSYKRRITASPPLFPRSLTGSKLPSERTVGSLSCLFLRQAWENGALPRRRRFFLGHLREKTVGKTVGSLSCLFLNQAWGNGALPRRRRFSLVTYGKNRRLFVLMEKRGRDFPAFPSRGRWLDQGSRRMRCFYLKTLRGKTVRLTSF